MVDPCQTPPGRATLDIEAQTPPQSESGPGPDPAQPRFDLEAQTPSELPDLLHLPGLTRYNPFYWFLLFLPLYVAMAFGRACHTAIGQGPKPRAPGQDSKAFRLEHEVRMQWVYSFDGFFVAMAAIYGAILIYSAADPRGAYSARTVRRYAAAFGVCAAYAAGNVAFL